MKSAKRRSITLRAPSTELKAVWQNLLTRQILIVTSTTLNSPLESPDVLFSQQGDFNLLANSTTSIKMCSIESIHRQGNQQVNNILIEMQILWIYQWIFFQNQAKSNGERVFNSEKKIESSPKITRRMEQLIDEKCSLLSKSGISKEGTVHLAQWMKGQFNKQVCASDPIESDEDENSQLNDWSEEDVKRRSSELRLLDDAKKPDENLSEDDQKSVSKSTTSDSQVRIPKADRN